MCGREAILVPSRNLCSVRFVQSRLRYAFLPALNDHRSMQSKWLIALLE
jgi:hypothetical protein